jgi:hypothetical protein
MKMPIFARKAQSAEPKKTECRYCGRLVDVGACADCACHRPASDPVHDPRMLGHYFETGAR